MSQQRSWKITEYRELPSAKHASYHTPDCGMISLLNLPHWQEERATVVAVAEQCVGAFRCLRDLSLAAAQELAVQTAIKTVRGLVWSGWKSSRWAVSYSALFQLIVYLRAQTPSHRTALAKQIHILW